MSIEHTHKTCFSKTKPQQPYQRINFRCKRTVRRLEFSSQFLRDSMNCISFDNSSLTHIVRHESRTHSRRATHRIFIRFARRRCLHSSLRFVYYEQCLLDHKTQSLRRSHRQNCLTSPWAWRAQADLPRKLDTWWQPVHAVSTTLRSMPTSTASRSCRPNRRDDAVHQQRTRARVSAHQHKPLRTTYTRFDNHVCCRRDKRNRRHGWKRERHPNSDRNVVRVAIVGDWDRAREIDDLFSALFVGYKAASGMCERAQR